jgi:hypothetical protein
MKVDRIELKSQTLIFLDHTCFGVILTPPDLSGEIVSMSKLADAAVRHKPGAYRSTLVTDNSV